MMMTTDFRFSSLSTLGDPPINHLTSSYYVAEKRDLAREILSYASFEDAVDAMRNGTAEVALVAGAYPKIRSFIMDPTLTCIEAFVEKIPPLVLVGTQMTPPAHVKTIYLHPATIPFLGALNIAYDATVETKATSAAAALAQKDENSIAICNQLAADYYRLSIHQILGPSVSMPFALFQNAALT
jgi:prephenate dehydratase